jgi:hypothetical protein
MAKNKKVIKYRRGHERLITCATFIVILVYIVCFVFLYNTKSAVKTYETTLGSLYDSETFTALAIRDEKIYNSDYSGYINYYQREGTKVASGDIICSVDETGRVADLLANYKTDISNALNSDELAVLKETLNKYKVNFSSDSFNEIYNLKTDLNASILTSINENIMANLDSLIESTGDSNFFNCINSPASGVVIYNTDGYENFNEDGLSKVSFDKSKYQKNTLKNVTSNSMVSSGDNAFKLIESENWNLYVELSKNQIKKLNLDGTNIVTLNFKSDGISTDCDFEIIEVNGKYYGKMSLSKYMIRYATQRFIDVEIVVDSSLGIKVPASSITRKDFYYLPKSYLTNSGSDVGFLIRYYDKNNLVETFVSTDIYYTDTAGTEDTGDDYVYVDPNVFPNTNFTLLKTNSTESFSDIKMSELPGVYCVNSGFTVFKVAIVLKQNDEYFVLKNNVSKGVELYDRIVLDASKYSEGQLIY